MPLFSEKMKFEHQNYTVPFCEYDNKVDNFEEKAFTINKLNHFKKVDKNIRGIFDWLSREINKFGCNAFKDDNMLFEESRKKEGIMNMARVKVLQGRMSQKEAEAQTEVAVIRTKELLKNCEENMFAAKRFYLWMNEMRRKEAVLEKLIEGIAEKSEDGGELSSFEKCVFDAFNEANGSDSNNPMDMSPIFMAWTEIPNYSPEDGEFEFSYYSKKLYPELKNANGAQKRLAKQHIYQYHVRYDFFTPRMLLDYFQMDIKIEHTKFDSLTRFRNECNYWVRKSVNAVKNHGTVRGREVFNEEYFRVAYISPAEFSLTDACTMCWGLGDLRKCSECDVLYCSQRCHQLGWPSHKNTCPGGGSKTVPPLIDGNGNLIDCERIEREYLCDPTKEFELFSSFAEHGDKENTKPLEKAKNRKFETPPVKNKYAGKKKRKKRK